MAMAAAASTAGISFPRRLLPNTRPPPPLTLPWRSAHRLSLLPSPPSPSLRLSRLLLASRSETLKNQEDEDDAEEEEIKETTTTESETSSSSSSSSSSSAVAKELKEMLAERKRKEEEEQPDLVAGVLAEVREIEWPPFSKVVGTTGVVIAVIAGSSVALLTVNGVLAELSDRVFAGRGLQDFFL